MTADFMSVKTVSSLSHKAEKEAARNTARENPGTSTGKRIFRILYLSDLPLSDTRVYKCSFTCKILFFVIYNKISGNSYEM